MKCPDSANDRGHGRANAVWLPALCLVMSALFSVLGFWQFQRLEWKAALIAQVQANTQAEALTVKRESDLSSLSPSADTYRRVVLHGDAHCEQAVPVWAATALGTGFWWMVPVRLADGSGVWLNQGYVDAAFVKTAQSGGGSFGKSGSCGSVPVSGLLRTTQTEGGFLRANNPDQARWYSRDVAALSKAQGLSRVNPQWFVDEGPAVSEASPTNRPVPGLTPLQWPNRHLGYALTWCFLALMAMAGAVTSSASARHFVVKCFMRVNRGRFGGSQRSSFGG